MTTKTKDIIQLEKESIIAEAINKHPLSMADAAKEANLPFGTFKYRAQKLGMYAPNQSHKGRIFNDGTKGSIPLIEIIKGKHPTYKTHRLKQRLYEAHLREEKCEECGQGTMWNGKPLVLELDHINGIKDDHRIKNLRILCMHCHSQTPTYKGRNIK